MQVTVIGAGVVGVCTAYYLNEAGCDVTVLERNNGVAQEASFGNAGVIAPGCVAPWAAPGMPKKVLTHLFAREAPVRFSPTLDPAMWGWVGRWLRECSTSRYRTNRSRMQRLAFYSRDKLAELRIDHGLAYERTQGYLQLLRSKRDVQLSEPAIALLKENAVPHQHLSPAECRVREPGLSDLEFAGGLFFPGDETGNCPLFTRLLKDRCVASGVRFEFGKSVTQIASQERGVVLRVNARDVECDALVIAAGVASAPLLRSFGVSLPLYPVKGYSATVAIREPTYAPAAALMDEAYQVAIVRMGNRIRIAGTAELGNRTLSLKTRAAQGALRTLIKVAGEWFPGAANYHSATWWTGARPMLPDGPPVLGATPHPRVFVNLGHGSSGWAMAAGSGKIVADVLMQRTPDIDLEGLTLARYSRT